jgi:predicted phage terminase large subunit-like protein
MQHILNRQMCARNLSAFVKYFWPVIEPNTPLYWGWHTQAICDHLQAVTRGKINRLIICLPPGHMKSILINVMWPAWEWVENPSECSLFGSYEESLTFRDAGKFRDIILSEEYQLLFQPMWEIDRDSLSYITNTVHGDRKCYFMTSRKKTGWRGNKVVVDDPLSAEDRYDKKIKLEVTETYDKVLSTRVNSINSAFVIIMQRLAEDDLVGFIKEKYGDDYTYLILSTEFESKRRCSTSIGFTDPRQHDGELLFPQLYPRRRIEGEKLRLGPVDFAAQHQHEPFLSAGNRFKSEYFRYWSWTGVPNIIQLHHSDDKVERIRIDRCERFMTVDLACTEEKKATGDYTSIGHWATTPRHDMILLNRLKVKEEEPGVIRAVKSVYEDKMFGPVPPSYVGMEANGLGKPISQNAKWHGLPVVEIHVHKDKEVLSANAIVRIEGGQVFWPEADIYPWVPEFLRELLSFPTGAHDDDVTMVSLAANSFYEIVQNTIQDVQVLNGHTPPHINPLRITADLSGRKFFGVR